MKHQASKEVFVAAFITDSSGRVLIVNPIHKDGWILPGGIVEHREAPSDACVREVEAEVGIRINRPSQLLSIDYRGSTDEYIMLIFDCGVFTEETIEKIKLPTGRLTEYRFVTREEAMTMLRPKSALRMVSTYVAKEQDKTMYLENEVAF